MSLLNSRTSSLSRSDRLRPFPHEHSNSVRCSERQSSSKPKSISRSPQPHSRTMRPEDSKVCSSGSTELSTYSPFRPPLGEATRRRGGGKAAPAVVSVHRAGPGHALADCPPPTIPVKCAPADKPSHNLHHTKTVTRSTKVTFKAWLRSNVFRLSGAKKERGPARGGVDRASSRGIIGKRAAKFQLFAHHVVAVGVQCPMCWVLLIRLCAAAARCSTLWDTHATPGAQRYRG